MTLPENASPGYVPNDVEESRPPAVRTDGAGGTA